MYRFKAMLGLTNQLMFKVFKSSCAVSTKPEVTFSKQRIYIDGLIFPLSFLILMMVKIGAIFVI